jgi:hypothetical protein
LGHLGKQLRDLQLLMITLAKALKDPCDITITKVDGVRFPEQYASSSNVDANTWPTPLRIATCLSDLQYKYFEVLEVWESLSDHEKINLTPPPECKVEMNGES